MLRHHPPPWALAFVGWTLIGFFYSIHGGPGDYGDSLKSSLAQWYIWGVLTPLIRIEAMSIVGLKLVPALREPMARASKLAVRKVALVILFVCCVKIIDPPIPAPTNRPGSSCATSTDA